MSLDEQMYSLWLFGFQAAFVNKNSVLNLLAWLNKIKVLVFLMWLISVCECVLLLPEHWNTLSLTEPDEMESAALCVNVCLVAVDQF